MEKSQEILDHILKRNKRVETDKAWETSWTRRIFIMVITYLTACLFLWSIGTSLFYVQALVPTGGYFLSTISLPWLKRIWVSTHKSQS